MARTTLLSLLSACALPLFVVADKITVKEGIVADDRSREADPEIHLFQPFSRLNRITFGKNVLQPSTNGVERWAVLFCLHWYEPCEALERPFATAGGEWQRRLNADLLSTAVRFATVDCAADRALCNEQMIYEFPQIKIYHKHSAVSAWAGDGDYAELVGGMREWLGQELGALAVDRQGMEEYENKVSDQNCFCLDVFVIILAMLGNAWLVARKPDINSAKKLWAAFHAQQGDDLAMTSVGGLLPQDRARERAELEM